MVNTVAKLRHQPQPGRIVDHAVGIPDADTLLEGMHLACQQDPQGVRTIILLPGMIQAAITAFKTGGVYHGIKDEHTNGWFANQFRLRCGCVVNVLSKTALGLN